jgi:hypothetical protein
MDTRYLLINGALKHNVFLNQGLFGPVKHKNNTVLGKIKLFTPTFQTSRMLQIPLEIPSYLHKTYQPLIPFPLKNLILSNVSLDQKKNDS